MVTEQRRMTDTKRQRAHKRIRRRSEALEGSILHSKTRWKSSRGSYHEIWILERNQDTKSKEKQVGPLKASEINKLIKMLTKWEQSIVETTESIQNTVKQLNLAKNHNEVYQCQGKIQGDYPIYIPRNSKVAEKIVQHFYKKTLHRGVVLKITEWETSIGF